MAVHPLRPATHRGLGEPLPHQQANGARAPPVARKALTSKTEILEVLCGISSPFGKLSPTSGQIAHVLLTRLPLYSRTEVHFLVRLACVKHAASVRSEPGSNSPVNVGIRLPKEPVHVHQRISVVIALLPERPNLIQRTDLTLVDCPDSSPAFPRTGVCASRSWPP